MVDGVLVAKTIEGEDDRSRPRKSNCTWLASDIGCKHLCRRASDGVFQARRRWPCIAANECVRRGAWQPVIGTFQLVATGEASAPDCGLIGSGPESPCCLKVSTRGVGQAHPKVGWGGPNHPFIVLATGCSRLGQGEAHAAWPCRLETHGFRPLICWWFQHQHRHKVHAIAVCAPGGRLMPSVVSTGTGGLAKPAIHRFTCPASNCPSWRITASQTGCSRPRCRLPARTSSKLPCSATDHGRQCARCGTRASVPEANVERSCRGGGR